MTRRGKTVQEDDYDRTLQDKNGTRQDDNTTGQDKTVRERQRQLSQGNVRYPWAL